MPADEYVVHPEGDLDLATVGPLRSAWMRIAQEEQPRVLVIDLGEVTFLDSTALSMFVQVLRKQREHGGVVAVVNASPMVRTAFRVTRLDAVFDVR